MSQLRQFPEFREFQNSIVTQGSTAALRGVGQLELWESCNSRKPVAFDSF
jgi:hypothetical protein